MLDVVLIYFVAGALGTVFCIWLNRRFKVSSLLAEAVGNILIWPSAAFGIFLFWPVAFVCDLLTISSRRKEKYSFLINELAQRREARRVKKEEREAYREVIGKTGVTATPLCLAGKVNIAGKVWDAHSLDGYLSTDEKVVVKKRVGNELKVKLIKKN